LSICRERFELESIKTHSQQRQPASAASTGRFIWLFCLFVAVFVEFIAMFFEALAHEPSVRLFSSKSHHLALCPNESALCRNPMAV
jgi:hypothetical protein